MLKSQDPMAPEPSNPKDKYEKIKELLSSIDDLKKSVGIAKNLKECGISSKDFNAHLEDLCFDLTEEQSTHAAIKPTKEQIKKILLEAFEG